MPVQNGHLGVLADVKDEGIDFHNLKSSTGKTSTRLHRKEQRNPKSLVHTQLTPMQIFCWWQGPETRFFTFSPSSHLFQDSKQPRKLSSPRCLLSPQIPRCFQVPSRSCYHSRYPWSCLLTAPVHWCSQLDLGNCGGTEETSGQQLEIPHTLPPPWSRVRKGFKTPPLTHTPL